MKIMVLKQKAISSKKVMRSPDENTIHYLFIFNKAGTCLYSRNFTNFIRFEDSLVSGLFSAIQTFTNEVIGKKVESVNMGDLKFSIFEKEQLIYGLLCDMKESSTFLNLLTDRMNSEFLKYLERNNIDIKKHGVYGQKIDSLIENVVRNAHSKEFDLHKELIIIEYLKNFSADTAVKDLIFLTNQGKILHSTMQSGELQNFIKEIEFRVKIFNNSILRMYYENDKKELVFSKLVEKTYLIILVFDSTFKFGIAEYYLDKIVSFITKILITD